MSAPALEESPVDPRGIRRILVTRLRYLGDVVLSTPLLEVLRERFPDASIEYLSFAPYAEVLREHPCVDRVHALPAGSGLAETWRMVARLGKPRVDWWIDLFGNPRSALLCLLARPRLSTGTDRGLRSRIFSHRLGDPPGRPSAVAHHLHKLSPLLGEVEERPVRLAASTAEREAARTRWGIDTMHRPVLLHPGSTWPSKAWPEEKWMQLVDFLRSRLDAEFYVLSPPGDETTAHRIAESAGARAIPPLPLRGLMGLIAESRAYVGNDGGILHAAVGLGTPTVGIFGPTEPEIWFPHEAGGKARLAQEYVACRPCHLHQCDHLSCLVALPVSRVGRLLLELLSEPEGVAARA